MHTCDLEKGNAMYFVVVLSTRHINISPLVTKYCLCKTGRHIYLFKISTFTTVKESNKVHFVIPVCANNLENETN